MSTLESIIIVRKSTNIPPVKQRVTKLHAWFDHKKEYREAQALKQSIAKAREARLCKN